MKKKEPDFIFTRKELVSYFNRLHPEGKTINRHVRDENGKIISTQSVSSPFNHMDIAEYCRKGFSPLKYQPDMIITANTLAWNNASVIKKMETFNIYIKK